MYYSIWASADTTPGADLILKDVSCTLAWEDPETQDNFKFNNKIKELPNEEDFDNYWDYQEYTDAREYSLYKVGQTTYAHETYAIVENDDLNNNGIFDRAENNQVGLLLYNCEYTVKNIGGAISEDDYNILRFTYEILVEQKIQGARNIYSQHWGYIPAMKRNEEVTIKLNNSMIFFPNRVHLGNQGLGAKDSLKLRITANKHSEPDMFPRYMNKALGRTLYKNSQDEVSERELIPETNLHNNSFIYDLPLPKMDFPDYAKNVELEINEDKKEVLISWSPVDNADSYELYLAFFFKNTLNPFSGKVQTLEFDKDTTEYLLDYSNLDITDSVYIRVWSLNNFGKIQSQRLYFKPPVNYFKDVPKGAWFEEGVNNAFRWGAIKGYSDAQGNPTHMFMPTRNVSKAEAVAIMMYANTLDRNEQSLVPLQYKNQWYSYLLNYLIQTNYRLVENNLNLQEDITRAELVQFVMEYKYLLNRDTRKAFESNLDVDAAFEYTFEDIRNHPLKKYIQFAYDMNIINGFDDGTFRPDAKLNRAQAIKILDNMKKSSYRYAN